MDAWGKKARRGFLRLGMEVFPASAGWTMFSRDIIRDTSARLLPLSIHKKRGGGEKNSFQQQAKERIVHIC